MTSQLHKTFVPMFVTLVIAGFILSILAPYGTHSFSRIQRLAYWIVLCMAGGIGATGVDWLFRNQNLSLWHNTLGQSLGATGVVSIFVLFLFESFTPGSSNNNYWLTLFNIWIVAIVICSVGALQTQAKTAVKTAANANPDISAGNTAKPPALLSRLELKHSNAELYAIVSEDHYVRIYTSRGEQMILMRLSDAIIEAAPQDGLSPHRSWWVAKAGVKSAARKNGKIVLTLHNDVSVPVSRNGSKAVKEAGWI